MDRKGIQMNDNTAAIAAAKAHQAIMDMADAFRMSERSRIISIIRAGYDVAPLEDAGEKLISIIERGK